MPALKRRQEVETALTVLQEVGVQVQRWPRRGRKGEWLVYASLELPASANSPADTEDKAQR
jgi:hypothetical protein